MNTRVVTVEMDDSLDTIRDIFQRVRFHHVLVVSDRKLVGVISDRDLLKAISPFVGTLSETTRDRDTLNKRAHQIMSRQPVTVSKETRLKDALKILLDKNISCLPVTNADGEVEGIVTWKDMVKVLVRGECSV